MFPSPSKAFRRFYRRKRLFAAYIEKTLVTFLIPSALGDHLDREADVLRR